MVQHSSRLIIGYADTVGKRPTMEDDMAIVGNLQGKEDLDFVGVFDGHGGREVSSFAAKTLPNVNAPKKKKEIFPMMNFFFSKNFSWLHKIWK